MTTIVIHKDSKGAYEGFVCMGHAGYAKKFLWRQDPDILCASISVLVINTINAMEELAGEKLSVVTNEETGFIKCDINAPLSERSVFLLDAMVMGLEQLSHTYGEKYLQVRLEEV